MSKFEQFSIPTVADVKFNVQVAFPLETEFTQDCRTELFKSIVFISDNSYCSE